MDVKMKKFMKRAGEWLSGRSGMALYATLLLIAVLVTLNSVVYALTNKYQIYLSSPEKEVIPLSNASELYFERAMLGGRRVSVIFCDDEEDVQNHDLGKLVYETATRLKEMHPDFIELRFVNSVTGYEAATKEYVDLKPYTEDGTVRIRPTSIIFECEGNFRVMTGGSTGYEDFFSLTSSGEVYAYNGEEVLASMICWVTESEHKTVYFTQNHGETADIALNSAFVSAGYYVDTINLRKQNVPDDAALVVISNPINDFEKSADGSDATAELDRLEKYLSRGGNLYVALDPLVKKLNNLEEYLAKWGFELYEGEDENGNIARDIVRDSTTGDTADGYRFILTPVENGYSTPIFGLMNEYVDTSVRISQTGRLKLLGGAVALMRSSETSVAARSGEIIDNEGSYDVIGFNRITNEDGSEATVMVVPSVFLTSTENMVNNTYTNKAFVLATLATHFGAKQAPIGCQSLIYRGATLEGLTMGRARAYTAIMLAIPAAIAVAGTVIIIKRKNRL